MNTQDLKQLERAVKLLENPNMAIKVSHLLGAPIEKGIALLPAGAVQKISAVTQKTIEGCLTVALKTMDTTENEHNQMESSDTWHTLASAVTGAVGGLFGFSALMIELPISTTIMMRSIADVARSEGANLQDVNTQLDCIQVLALGGKSTQDDDAEIAYFMARAALAQSMAEAAAHLTKKGLEKEAAPAIIKLIVQISERFSISVTEKMAAQSIPIIGAAGGALVNTLFISHFQDMARGHFIVRRLEKIYGIAYVQQKYNDIYNAVVV